MRRMQASSPALTIRHATTDDLEVLAELYARCMAGAPGDEQWSQPRARAFLAMWLQRQPDLFLVAEVEGRVVGGTICDLKPYFDGPRFTEGEMFVEPAVRHLGVARALLQQRLSEAGPRYGVVAIESLANGHSPIVLDWLTRLGFQRTEWIHMEVPIAVLRARLGPDPDPDSP